MRRYTVIKKYHRVEPLIPLTLKGSVHQVFSVTIELLDEQSKILVNKFCFAHGEILK